MNVVQEIVNSDRAETLQLRVLKVFIREEINAHYADVTSHTDVR
jgi:hypothetical protein